MKAEDPDYMYLKNGDIINITDEIMLRDGEWIIPMINLVVGMKFDNRFMQPHRRVIPVEIKNLI